MGQVGDLEVVEPLHNELESGVLHEEPDEVAVVLVEFDAVALHEYLAVVVDTGIGRFLCYWRVT